MQGLRSRPIEVQKGLQQECPLFPLLFMLLLSDLDGELERYGEGFDLTYMDSGQIVWQVLPGLLYANDIARRKASRSCWMSAPHMQSS